MRLQQVHASASIFSSRVPSQVLARNVCGLAPFRPLVESRLTGPCMGEARRNAGTKRARTGTVMAAGNGAEYDFDLFTIGGGTAGVRAARLSANLGARSALCELPFGLVMTDETGGTGGTCVLRGCVPKKLLHYVGEFKEALEDAEASGWDVQSHPKVNFGKVMELKNKELERLSQLYKGNLDKAGVTFIEGRGKVTGPNSVAVNGKEYKVKNILVATGSKATKAPIEGSELGIISDEVLSLDKLPSKMVIIGSSYIACEQATIYNNLGTEVHLMNRGDLILKGFDKECREFIQKLYQDLGITVHLDSSPTKLEKSDGGKIKMTVKHKDDKEEALEGIDHVLFATGRKPNTQGLGLEELGVEMDPKGGVKVDKYSRSVSTPSIWAVGDVSNRIPLTPVARMEGNMLANHLFGKSNQEDYKVDHSAVAKVVFSSPPFASVGLTEEEAIEEHKNVDIFTSEFTPMKSSLSKRKGSKSFAKMVSMADGGKVLGVHFVGPEAAEIVQGFAVCVKQGLSKRQVDATVGLHPTSAEEFVLMSSPARQFRDGKLWLKQS